MGGGRGEGHERRGFTEVRLAGGGLSFVLGAGCGEQQREAKPFLITSVVKSAQPLVQHQLRSTGRSLQPGMVALLGSAHARARRRREEPRPASPASQICQSPSHNSH